VSDPLLARLASADPEERREACRQAATHPAATLFADALARALADPSKAVVRAASDALVAIQRGPGGALDALRDALHGHAPGARFAAAFTLARLEPPSPKLLPALVEALGSDDGDVRWAAARLLVDMGRLHGEVLPVLVGLARAGEGAAVRRMAAFALRSLAPDRPEAAQVLLSATRDPDVDVRRAALTALAALLDPPREVAARLVEVLSADPDAPSQRLAALALGELGAASPAALPAGAHAALARAQAESLDTDLRRAAARSLAKLAGARAGAGDQGART
jgi:HEAT repeat protein